MSEPARWRFLDPNKPNEAVFRQHTLDSIDAWWAAFTERNEDISALFRQEKNWDLAEWMQNTLQKVHADLMWEYGPAVNCDGHRLVITPENKRHLRPVVDTLLERAPKLDGWEFYSYRLAEDLQTAGETVDARTGGSLEGFTAFVSPGEHNLIDITFCAPKKKGSDDRQVFDDVFVASDALLGERILDRWIGAVDVVKSASQHMRDRSSPTPKGKQVLLEHLKSSVETQIDVNLNSLPETPHLHWVNETEWYLLELKPPKQDEYAHQHDLFVAKTPNLELWQATHSQLLFFDERFSRHGETFAYIKLDGSQGVDKESFADKAEIENRLDQLLIPRDLGCQIGGGTGNRYSYIDIALTRVEEGIRAISECLRAGNVPKRSWIQFFDANLAHEWVGIYPDSPPPPMRA